MMRLEAEDGLSITTNNARVMPWPPSVLLGSQPDAGNGM